MVLEAEDIELGVGSQDLALDVDDGIPEEDPEALDSVDEDSADDVEESDCESNLQIRLNISKRIHFSSHACRSTIFSST